MKVFPINDKINEYDYDPDLGIGVPWIRRNVGAGTYNLSHTLLQIGLTAATEAPDTYTFKVKSKNGETLKINLEKEV